MRLKGSRGEGRAATASEGETPSTGKEKGKDSNGGLSSEEEDDGTEAYYGSGGVLEGG